MPEEKKKHDAVLTGSVMVKEMECKEDGRILYFYSFVSTDPKGIQSQTQSTAEASAGEEQ